MIFAKLRISVAELQEISGGSPGLRRRRCVIRGLPAVSLLWMWLATAAAAADVRINEVMTSNGSTVADLAGEYGDWIELFNDGAGPVDLSGWGLSDDPGRPFRWVFPEAVLPAGGYLLVWATGAERERVFAPEVLVPARASWKYHDQGVDFGDAFKEPGFDDSAWVSGVAPLGYGPLANYVTTTISFGGDPQNKHITTWFRRGFHVEDPSIVDSLDLRLWIDDGAVVYLNGEEIARENLPAGAIGAETRTLTYVGSWPSWTSHAVPPSALVAGENTLAVRLHQHAPTSSDLAFELELAAVVERRELHAGFSLSKDGEPVVLTRPDGTEHDRVDVPPLRRDVSYGRLPEDPAVWRYFGQATPGGPNTSEAFEGILDPPVFTTDPGFYPGPVVVDAVHDDGGAVLRFTTNGRPPGAHDAVWSGPLTLDAAEWSAGPLSMVRTTPVEGNSRGYGWFAPVGEVPKGRVLRLRAEKPGHLPSEAVGGTWWVGEGFSGRHSLPVVSLQIDADDFFDNVRGIYVPGRLYDIGGFGSDWWGRPHANYFQRGEDWERAIHFEFFEDGGRAVAGNLAVRLHGGGSRVLPQKSLRLYDRGGGALEYPFFANAGRRPHTAFSRLLLRNSGQDWYEYGPTMLKDAYLQRLVSHLDFETQDYRPTVVYLNGEYWGIHNLRERIDTRYLARLFGVDPEQVDLLNNNASPKAGSAADFLALRDFIHTQSMAVPENYQYVAERIDLSSFIDYHIANIFLANTDWPGNNIDYWRVRREPDATVPKGHDGRWRWIMFDLDFCAQQGNVNVDMIQRLKSPTSGWPRPEWSLRMIRGLWESPEFVAAFCTRFADHLNTTFQAGRAHDLVDVMEAAIEDEIIAHFRRWGRDTTIGTWRSNVRRLRDFATNRPAPVWAHIASHFPTEGTAWVTIQQPGGGHVRINSIHLDGSLTQVVEGRPAQWQGRWFRAWPVEIEAIADEGMIFSHWEETGGTDAHLSMALVSDVVLTPVFVAAPPSVLLHYWTFNDAGDLLSPAHTLGGGALAVAAGAASEFTTGGGQGFSGENNHRLMDAGGHLRVNQPVDSALVFSLPTPGYAPHSLAYEARRSGNGAALHVFSHTIDGGLSWHPLATVVPPDGDPEVFRIALGAIDGAADNPDFAIRIEIRQGIGGDAGNNRIDNLTLHGWPLDGTIPPPEPVAIPAAATWIAGAGLAIDPAPYFHSPAGMALAFQMENTEGLFTAVAGEGGHLAVTPHRHGGGVARLTATVAGHPGAGSATLEFDVLVHPAAHPLADGFFGFSEWSPEAPAGVMPDGLLFLQSTVSDPGIDTPLPHAYHVPLADMAAADVDARRLALPYQLTARTRINALGSAGVSFINTGRGRDLGAAVTTLDTRGIPAAEVSWTAGTVTPNSRHYGIRLQYRTAIDAPWQDLIGDDGLPAGYERADLPGDERRIGPHLLPPDALERPFVQLRWVYHHVGGDSGPRDELRIDDVMVRVPPAGAHTYQTWAAAHFAAGDPSRHADVAVAGDGVSNLFRHAHGLAPDDATAPVMPRWSAGDRAFRFRHDPSKTDVAWIIRASQDLSDWSGVWFDSRVDPPPVADADGWVSVPLPEPAAPRVFARLEIVADAPEP